MRKLAFLVAVVLVIALGGTVWAADENAAGVLSRGEFAAMLVEAAGLEGDLPAAQLLMEKGIMKGNPAGDLNLDRGITRMEAVALTAKTLGLEGSIAPPAGVEVPLAQDHWGYNYYGWFIRQGLVEGSPTVILTEEQGAAFLAKVFSTNTEAVDLMEEYQTRVQEMTDRSLRMVMSGSIKMIARPGIEGAKEFPAINAHMRIAQDYVPPSTIHQDITVIMDGPDSVRQELAIEGYIADGKMYQKMSVLGVEDGQWYQYPNEMMPALEGILKQAEQQTDVIPAGLEDYFHYQLLGTKEIDGEKVYVVSFYGCVDDVDKFLDTALSQLGDGQLLQQFLGELSSMFKSMSYWGIQYLGVDDYLLRGGDFAMVINFADTIMGQPMPIVAIHMYMNIEESQYGGLEITVPAEVLAAPVLDMTQPSRLEEPESAASGA